jgi:hypothetical protein
LVHRKSRITYCSSSILQRLVRVPLYGIPKSAFKCSHLRRCLRTRVNLSSMSIPLLEKALHNVLISSRSVRSILLDLPKRCGPHRPIELAELHEVSELWDSLGPIRDISATVVSHDVGVSACACRRVVDVLAFVGLANTVIVLVQH